MVARAMAGIPCPDRPLCFGFIDTQSATQTSAVQLIAAKTQPSTTRVTQGDAQAVFDANQNGGTRYSCTAGSMLVRLPTIPVAGSGSAPSSTGGITARSTGT